MLLRRQFLSITITNDQRGLCGPHRFFNLPTRYAFLVDTLITFLLTNLTVSRKHACRSIYPVFG